MTETTSQGAASGVPARGYSWEPFTAGNEVSVQHGAWSPRRVDPLADEIVTGLLADDDVAFLRAPAYRLAVWALGRAEARVQLLDEFIADQGGIAEALAEHGEETSEEQHNGGSSRRVSRSRRVGSALAALDRAERHAAACRSRLGLDPLSRARLGKDVAAATVDVAQWLSAERERIEREQAATAEPSSDGPGGAL